MKTYRRDKSVRSSFATMESMENQSSGGMAEAGIGCVKPSESTLSAIDPNPKPPRKQVST